MAVLLRHVGHGFWSGNGASRAPLSRRQLVSTIVKGHWRERVGGGGGGAGVPKSGMLCFFVAFSSSIIAFVTDTPLQIGTVRRQLCCLSRASDVMVVVSALHGLSGVPIGALLVALQQWLLVASVWRTFLVR